MHNTFKKSLAAIAAFISIFIAITLNSALSEEQQKRPPDEAEFQYPIVSVEAVSATKERGKVITYGEVKSRNQLDLTSQVTGKIAFISPKFLSGHTFAKGELLVAIEDIQYQQALASAKASLAEATLSLAQEKLNHRLSLETQKPATIAKTQSTLLQLEVAQAKYDSAMVNVKKAQYDLNQTKITAPFNALVTAKSVQVGSNVQSGEKIATLYDTELLEVSLPLSATQWQLIPHRLSETNVTLVDESTSQQWKATLERSEQHVNPQNRQRSLIATVANRDLESSQLFTGTFVKATIQGELKTGLWKLPASALIDGNKVWQVNEQGLLSELSVQFAFSIDEFVYVRPSSHVASAYIVKRPLASYVENMKVDARVEPPHDNSQTELVSLVSEDQLVIGDNL